RNLRAKVCERVRGRDGNIPLLVAYAVAEVRPAHVVLAPARTPDALVRVYAVARGVRLVLYFDAVEDEELGLRAEVGGVGDAREFKITLGALRHRARVEPVALLRNRVYGVGYNAQRRLFGERLHPDAARVGDEQHVGLVYGGPAAYRGGIEAEAVLEGAFVELVYGKRQVLPGPDEVCETNRDELRLVVFC